MILTKNERDNNVWSDQPNFLCEIRSLDPNSLLTQLSLLPLVQIQKFQCLTTREFPELFKTHPTVVSRSIFKASRRLQNKEASFIVGGCIQPRLNKFVLLYLKPITQVWELLLGHVGIFLDSSGSQLSFEHKRQTILPKNCWENWIWSWVPYCKRKANELWVQFTLYSIILAYPTKELLNLIQFQNFLKIPFVITCH